MGIKLLILLCLDNRAFRLLSGLAGSQSGGSGSTDTKTDSKKHGQGIPASF